MNLQKYGWMEYLCIYRKLSVANLIKYKGMHLRVGAGPGDCEGVGGPDP